eukprot:scaffold319_cov97-Cylindrotheca_fusiformis.AAC.8
MVDSVDLNENCVLLPHSISIIIINIVIWTSQDFFFHTSSSVLVGIIMNNDDNFSKASLEAEIISLERSLEELELKREELKGSTFIVKPQPKRKQKQQPLPIRWNELTIQTDSLVFAKEFCEWRETFARKVNANFGGIDLFLEAEMCALLAQLIGKYSNLLLSSSSASLYEEYYLPLFEYCYEHLIQLFRQELSRFHYPKHCSKLIATCRKNNKTNKKKKQQQEEHVGGIKNSTTTTTTTTIQIIAQRLTNLERQHGHLVSLLEINDDDDKSHTTTTPPVVVLELLAPIVEKVKFHFVTPSSDRITTQRIDRLPEWLLSYLREQHVVVPLQSQSQQQQKQKHKKRGGSGGPYELAMLLFQEDEDKEENKNEEHGLSQTVLVTHHYRNELVRLVQWVLETRNFFRNPQIISNQPILLYNAMEEFIHFDKELQIMTAASVTHNNNNNQYPPPLLGLMDCLVCSDDELMHWWIQRERESVFSMLLLDDDDDDNEHDTVGPAATTANHVSPRAELFCALIRSTRYKASVLSVPALYLKQVVVPLCTQFVDALQETSAEAIARLCRRPSSSSRRRIYNGDGMPTTSELAANIYKWIQILNGTHLAAQIIGPDATATSWQQDGGTSAAAAAISRSDHDLARFGRSLEHLKGVLVDEFGTAYCETIIMERAKCASYIMLASHLLASRPEDRNDIMTTTTEDDDEDWWLSVELRDTKVAVDILTKVCDSVGGGISSHDANGPTTGDGGQQEHNQQQQQQQQQRLAPPLEMKKQVMERLAGKFMEVAMDIHAMTPDIYQAGAKVFARDVKIMFQSSSSSFPLCRRLVDVVTLMTMDSKSSQGLFYALSGLTGSRGGRSLDIRDLVNDERLFEEASNMVRAKGLVSLELEDVISILNRRRD